MLSRRYLNVLRRKKSTLIISFIIIAIVIFKWGNPFSKTQKHQTYKKAPQVFQYGQYYENNDDVMDKINNKNDYEDIEKLKHRNKRRPALPGFAKMKDEFGMQLEEDDNDNMNKINKVKSKKEVLNKLTNILDLPSNEEEETKRDKKMLQNGKKKIKEEIERGVEIGAIGRSLPDVRSNECKHKSYPAALPTTSIIIVFYDEGLKTLLRTIYSIVNRTPLHLISEIILIDDCSTKEHYTKELKVQLKELNYPIVIERTKQRFGWVLARVQGTEYANGDVLMFLDAHTEVTDGWLEPILSRIVDNRHHVVYPVIDHIHPKTLEYVNDTRSVPVGVFDWSFDITWQHYQKEHTLARENDPTRPLTSPTMTDTVFAINREFFIKLDGYDTFYTTENMADLDLSFKVWMCGGTIEMIPCSHVGHLHRHRMPFKLPGRGEINDKKRLAEIWLGEYKTFFYTLFPQAKKESPGDLDDQETLLKDLHCKSISWYWGNIYMNSIWPVNGERYGELHHIDSGKCLDIATEGGHLGGAAVSMVTCDGIGASQIWMLTSIGEIRNNFFCVESLDGVSVSASKCHRQRSNQEWMLDFSTNIIYHPASKHCLDYNTDLTALKHNTLTLQTCAPSTLQTWKLSQRG